MSVAQTVSLPDNPTTGTARLIVLTGGGFYAPKSMYEVQLTLTGDATGNLSTNVINTDPRFLSLVQRMEVTSLAGTPVEYQLIQTLAGSAVNSSVVGLTIANTTSSFNPSTAYWDPPGLLPISQVSSIIANVDTVVHVLTVWIYNFDINALNTVPLPILLAALARTSGQTTPL